MKKFGNPLIYLLLILLNINNLYAQKSAPAQPKLVVGIVIDGLQQRHIDLLWNKLKTNGLKKIIENGATFSQIQYNMIAAGKSADYATLVTGATPYSNGVVGDFYFNKNTKKIESILQDNSQAGIGANQRFSAKNLLSSTFTDELKMAEPSARVYAVAIDPETAIMLGGHTANGVVWADDGAMRWVTTSYYNGGLVREADQMNVNQRFTTESYSYWKPLYDINTYLNKPITEGITGTRFRYDMRVNTENGKTSALLKSAPMINSLVCELAGSIITQEKLGQQAATDVIFLEFTVRPPNENTTSMKSAEKEDMYYRLDADVENLLNTIDKTAGIANTLIFITSNQTPTHSAKELQDNGIPSGYFSPNRSMSLLNLYLMAIYGHEQWIAGYYGKNIYLNRDKIQEKKLNLNEMQRTVAGFMTEFEGVQAAYSADQIQVMSGNPSDETSRIRNSYQKIGASDVVISLLPGWQEVDENDNPVGTVNSGVSTAPIYFYGWKIPKMISAEKYFMTDFAPTISKMLDIPAPNANMGTPMQMDAR